MTALRRRPSSHGTWRCFFLRITPTRPTLVTLTAIVLSALVLTLTLSGCDGQTATTGGAGTATTTAGAGTATTAGAGAGTTPAAGRAVTFTTEDGITLGGHVFGSGSNGVILAHMYPADQTSWFRTAERLAGDGLLVLTFDFRGYGESAGTRQIDLMDRDVSAAVNQIRQEGAAQAALVGASMGGTASLIAGDRAQALSSIRLAGIATLSAPVEFRGLSAADAVPRIIVPLLFVAAENDVGAAGARELERLSSGKADLRILPGGDHGTNLLTGEQGEEVYTLLRDFLMRCMAL